MASTEDAFNHVPSTEWSCHVLRGEGLLLTNDAISSARPEGMLAHDAAITFVERHRKTRDGEALVRVHSPSGTMDFVARVTWSPTVCTYHSAFERRREPS